MEGGRSMKKTTTTGKRNLNIPDLWTVRQPSCLQECLPIITWFLAVVGFMITYHMKVTLPRLPYPIIGHLMDPGKVISYTFNCIPILICFLFIYMSLNSQ